MKPVGAGAPVGASLLRPFSGPESGTLFNALSAQKSQQAGHSLVRAGRRT